MIDVETFELERNRPHVRVAIFAGIAQRRVLRHRRAIAVVAGAGLMLSAGIAIGAAKTAPEQPPGSENYADCYTSEDLNASHNSFMSPGEVWSRGWILENCSQITRFDESDLGICISREGYTSVIPRPQDESDAELCERLGLPLWEGPQ